VNSKELNNSSKVFYAKKTLPETTAQSGEQGSKETEAPTCSICHRTFKRKLNLQLHYEKVHFCKKKVHNERSMFDGIFRNIFRIIFFTKTICICLQIHNIHEQPVVSELPETHRCSYCTRE